MRPLIIRLAFFLALGAPFVSKTASAQFATTPHFGFCMPPQGANGWAACYNNSFSVLDSAIYTLQNPYQGAWASGTAYKWGQYVSYGGVTYLSTANNNVGNVPSTSPASWAVASGGVAPGNCSGGQYVYQVTSSGVSCSTPAGSSGRGAYTLAFSAAPIFDATVAAEFIITLTGTVGSSTFVNGSGRVTGGPVLYTFRVVQDATGARSFTWPTNVHNPGVINPTASSTSIQVFSLNTDGSLDAAGPIMYR